MKNLIKKFVNITSSNTAFLALYAITSLTFLLIIAVSLPNTKSKLITMVAFIAMIIGAKYYIGAYNTPPNEKDS